MSIDTTIVIDKYIEKDQIIDVIISLGFEKTEHENTYYWFDNNFRSTRGCYFDFNYDEKILVDGKEVEYKTVCCAYTKSGRSYNDFKKQLDTIKVIENKFGGIVYSDGELGYFENDLPQLSRTEIACGFSYSTFEMNLAMVGNLIEDVNMEEVQGLMNLGIPPLNQKSLLRNNVLLPFFVSIMEDFLRTFLYRYIETREDVQNRIYKKKADLPYNVVKEIIDGEKNIIDIEIAKYSFQNFKSANQAYKEYLGLDLFKEVLSVEISRNDENKTLVSILQEMIENRHKIIHEASLNYDLDRRKMKLYYEGLKLLGNTFVEVFKTKRKMRIDLEQVL